MKIKVYGKRTTRGAVNAADFLAASESPVTNPPKGICKTAVKEREALVEKPNNVVGQLHPNRDLVIEEEDAKPTQKRGRRARQPEENPMIPVKKETYLQPIPDELAKIFDYKLHITDTDQQSSLDQKSSSIYQKSPSLPPLAYDIPHRSPLDLEKRCESPKLPSFPQPARSLRQDVSSSPRKKEFTLALVQQSKTLFDKKQERESRIKALQTENEAPRVPKSDDESSNCSILENVETVNQHPIILDAQTGVYVSSLLKCKNVSHCVEDFKAWTEERTPLLDIEKIAEGSFGEVYRATCRTTAETVIMKVIPLNARKGKGSRSFTTIEAAKNEVRMLEKMQRINGFVEFRGACVLQGRMPAHFVAEWDRYQSRGRTVESRDPSQKSSYADNQLWLLLEMSDAGTSLDSYLDVRWLPSQERFHSSTKLSVTQTWDIFWQTAQAVARAESERFEHRDLHLGNICVKPVRDSDECDNTAARVPSRDPLPFLLAHHRSRLDVTLIDYSLSRAPMPDGDVVFYDLVNDKALLSGAGDPQYDVYRAMAASFADGGCARFVPETNVRWLSYLMSTLCALTEEPSRAALLEVDGVVAVVGRMWAILSAMADSMLLGCRGYDRCRSAWEVLKWAGEMGFVELQEGMEVG